MSKKFVSILCIILAVLFVVSLITMVLPSAVGAVSQSQIDALNEQKQALAAKKQAASAQIATLKSQQAGYLEQKQALDDKCEIMRQDIDLLEKQINLYDDMIAQEGEKLETAEQKNEHNGCGVAGNLDIKRQLLDYDNYHVDYGRGRRCQADISCNFERRSSKSDNAIHCIFEELRKVPL